MLVEVENFCPIGSRMLLKLATQIKNIQYFTLVWEVFYSFFFYASRIIIIPSCKLVCGWEKGKKFCTEISDPCLRLSNTASQKPKAYNVAFGKVTFRQGQRPRRFQIMMIWSRPAGMEERQKGRSERLQNSFLCINANKILRKTKQFWNLVTISYVLKQFSRGFQTV